jgi:sulfur carrier protein
MGITINGENRDFDLPMTVAELLKVLAFDARSVLVERNLQVIDRDEMDSVFVCEGDTIEILRVLGGG